MGAPHVVVIGGGPAGAATASTLARLGVRATVLEARSAPYAKVGECLPPAAGPLLERLGLAERLGGGAHLRSLGNRYAWGSSVPAERHFLFGPGGAGWQLDRREFEATLAGAAVEAGADWRYGERVRGWTRLDPGWRLTVDGARGSATLDCDFVVVASGRANRFARGQGVRATRYDRLVGVAAYLEGDGRSSVDAFTFVEAVREGWWYSASLPGGRLAVVFMSDGDLGDFRRARQPDGWLALLSGADATRERVAGGGYRLVAAPRLCAAGSARLTAVTGKGWLAVGDAAAAHDPLASYGISAALGAGYYAARAIADLFQGSADALPTYQALVDTAFARYLLAHREQYRAERRWPDAPFWVRRREGSALSASGKRDPGSGHRASLHAPARIS